MVKIKINTKYYMYLPRPRNQHTKRRHMPNIHFLHALERQETRIERKKIITKSNVRLCWLLCLRSICFGSHIIRANKYIITMSPLPPCVLSTATHIMPTLRPIVRYGSYNHIVVCVMCVCVCALFLSISLWMCGSAELF